MGLIQAPKHSAYSASSSNRWGTCPAAKQMQKGIQGGTNPAAELGTAAHELGEFCLRMGVNAFDCIGLTFYKHVVDAAMCDAVQLYVSYIRNLCSKYGVNPMLEQRVVMTSVRDDVYGTSDCIIIIGDWVFVIDYKHGYGVVEVKNNSQAIFYAIATLDTFNLWGSVKYVHTAIVQPRADHVDGSIRECVYPIEHMYEWQTFFRNAVSASEQSNLIFITGSHCKYCLARGFCRARITATLDSIYFDKPIHLMSDEEISVIYSELPMIKTNIEAIAERALQIARNGGNIDGFKLVKSISRASCPDVDKFINAAISAGVPREKLFRETIVSMTDAKKLVPANIVDAHYVKPPASTSLVEITNPRVAVSVLNSEPVNATGIFGAI